MTSNPDTQVSLSSAESKKQIVASKEETKRGGRRENDLKSIYRMLASFLSAFHRREISGPDPLSPPSPLRSHVILPSVIFHAKLSKTSRDCVNPFLSAGAIQVSRVQHDVSHRRYHRYHRNPCRIANFNLDESKVKLRKTQGQAENPWSKQIANCRNGVCARVCACVFPPAPNKFTKQRRKAT